MKLQIEKWVEKIRPFDSHAEDLFQEAVICYKVGAYKSAFLMSYLAFKISFFLAIVKKLKMNIPIGRMLGINVPMQKKELLIVRR